MEKSGCIQPFEKEDGKEVKLTEFVAETLLPTSTGSFRVRSYRCSGDVNCLEPLVCHAFLFSRC